MAEYAVYPFEEMKITQRHDEGNHIPHWKPFIDHSDKPWDEACKDYGRSYFVPQNDYKVIQKLGNQDGGYNVRLTTLNKVVTPFKSEPDYLHLTLTHINYDDYSKLFVGQIIRKGQKLLREGTSGKSTGNHFHITAAFGTYYGFLKNANGKYCFVYDKSLLPNEAFFIDRKVTTIYDAKGYTFKDVPKPVEYKKGQSSPMIEKINNFLADKVKGNYFGDYTETNVKLFQKKSGLTQTGIVDETTMNKMKSDGFKG